jgi:hypothetical protein
VKHRSGAPILGRLLALPTGITLGWIARNKPSSLLCQSKGDEELFFCFVFLDRMEFHNQSRLERFTKKKFVQEVSSMSFNIIQEAAVAQLIEHFTSDVAFKNTLILS